PDQLVRDLVDQAAPPGAQLEELEGLRCRLDCDGVLQHQFAAWLPEDAAWPKLEEFLTQWQGRDSPRMESGIEANIPLKTSLWQRLGGVPRTLNIVIRWRRPGEGRQLAEITVRLRVGRAGERKNRRVLEQVAPLVLDGLRQFLMAGAEKRAHE